MENLEFLIGVWQTQGEVVAENENPPIKFQGTDRYEWILGKSFILHKVDVQMGKDKTEVYEFIGGFDTNTAKYKMRSFDNQGAFAEMEAHIDYKGVLHIVGKGIRSQLVRHDQNNLVANWERLSGETWVPWMNLRLSR